MPTEVAKLLGLPVGIQALLFDLDGVLTDTASVHRSAWKSTFDAFLGERALGEGVPVVPFDPGIDYALHVDGKPRLEGVRDFLASRGIVLPEGTLGDPTVAETLHGLGNRKNALVTQRIRAEGVRAFEGSRRYLVAARDAGLRRAVVSSSANTAEVLDATGLAPLVEVRVDGNTIGEQGLRGKPAPDTFLLAAELLGVPPDRAAVFEDAIAGVQAGRAGHFRHVVGVNRGQGHAALLANGADIVVDDLAELLEVGG